MYGYVPDTNSWVDVFGLMLALPAPSGSNPWGKNIESIVVPKGGMVVEMAIDIDIYSKYGPGNWATQDHIPSVEFVREKLAVTPEFKPRITHVQKFRIPEGVRVQIGDVGP